MDGRERRVRIANPVQHRIAEHGVELAVEVQDRHVRNPRVESMVPGRPDLLRTAVNGHHATAGLDQLLRQHPVAATDVEHPLAWSRAEQIDHRRPEVRDEPRVLAVLIRIPDLHRP